ncbi:MAG: helicase-related protein [Gallintestinimicrobium sp.]
MKDSGAFARGDADILVGTQMIVKGHDFPAVTLVGVLAADLSLSMSDYRAGERTFQLLTQAAGRAGRGSRPGEVVIRLTSRIIIAFSMLHGRIMRIL